MSAIITFMFFAVVYRVYVDIKNKADPIVPILGGSALGAIMIMLASATKQTRFFSVLAFAILVGTVVTAKDKTNGKNALSSFLTSTTTAPDAASNVVSIANAGPSTTASSAVPKISLAPRPSKTTYSNT